MPTLVSGALLLLPLLLAADVFFLKIMSPNITDTYDHVPYYVDAR